MDDDSLASGSFSMIELGMIEYHSLEFQLFNAIRLQIKSDDPNYVNMLKVYGMIAFQFDIHPMLMTIEVDMQNKAKIGSAVCYALACKVDNKITKK